MRIVIAPESLKESLRAVEVAAAVRAGMTQVWPDADFVEVPLADGGEGTVEAMMRAMGGELVTRRVSGPLGAPVQASYAVVEHGRTAVVELAAGSGLHLVALDDRDPGRASSYGTGELIADALDRWFERVVVGLGGSATNDGGAGLLSALGARVTDADGEVLPPGGAALAAAAHVDLTGLHPRLELVRIEGACDVDNPLLGAEGATAFFGPQKGVEPDEVAGLDQALRRWAEVLADAVGVDRRDDAGAGAAGGVGLALVSALGGRLRAGFDVVAETVGLREILAGADLVVTGEGCVDAQTMRGKAPAGVVALAVAAGVPVVVIGGSLGPGAEEMVRAGAVAVFGCVPAPGNVAEVLSHAAENLTRTAAQVSATWEAGRQSGPGLLDRSKTPVG
ncbi:glycerate kinase [soil metagenome]